MRILITEFSAAAGIFRFIVLFIVFIAVLVLAFYFTKWYANSGLVKKGYGNIKIIESYQLAPGKIIYIELNNTSFKDVMGQMISNRKMKDDDKKDGK